MIAVLFSFGAGIAGFALGSMIFGFAGSFQISVTLFVLSFGISYVILGIRTVVCCVILRKNINKALAVRNEKGYCDEYYSLLEKQCHKGNYKKRFYSLITYAGELADGERLEQAREVVGHIDTSRADRRMVAEYANAFIYICLMSGKYELANIIARGGQNILEEYAEKRCDGGNINHTLGVLEYVFGNLSKAESLFLRAKSQARQLYSKNACDMYLALIYLKTDRKEYAKSIVSGLINNIENPRQAQDVKKLMSLVEDAYGI